jgi:hypothetical protein
VIKRMTCAFLLCLIGKVCSEGFSAGTLVKTPTGYRPIEELVSADSVYCFKPSNNAFCIALINTTHKISYSKEELVRITCGNESFITTHDQRFLLHNGQWVCAGSLLPGALFRCLNKFINVTKVEFVESGADTYAVSIFEHQNYMITSHDIIVYNPIPKPRWYTQLVKPLQKLQQ